MRPVQTKRPLGKYEAAAARACGTTVEAMMSSSRDRRTSAARFILWLALRRDEGLPLTQIAYRYRRTPANISIAASRTAWKVKYDSWYREMYDRFVQLMGADPEHWALIHP